MDLDALLRHQEGVVSRSQVLASGLDDHDIARMVRRRQWARLFDGVFVDHTGPPSWLQRAWGATLVHGVSALCAYGAGAPANPIELVVDARRRVDDPRDVITRRTRAWDRVVQGHLSPPSLRLEIAALRAASRAGTEDAAVALLGDLVQRRRTTAARLAKSLDDEARLPRRRLLADVLADVGAGSLSALERRYLRDVERAHLLPRGSRQHRVSIDGTARFRDVRYERHGVVVGLDGRLGHELWQDRWADLDRDLHTLRDGSVTVRAGWGQVLQPCRATALLADVLVARGWSDRPQRCGPSCLLP